jgi:hypothetical protein
VSVCPPSGIHQLTKREQPRVITTRSHTAVTITLSVQSDEPVVVLVVPLRKAAPRSVPPPPARRVIETTAEPLPDNVVQLRRTA